MTDLSLPIRQLIPIPRDGFFGRERETLEMLQLLSRPGLSCLTILGPGGVGKTRLSLHVAQTIAGEKESAFPDGIWFVPLAQITRPEDVPVAIAHILDVEIGESPPIDTLCGFLKEREALLILDNVEQVIDCAALISQLANECADVKIIITSRHPLRISGEQEFLLEPLPVSSSAGNDLNPAVRLFVDRARMVNPGFQFDEMNLAIVHDVCSRLDGLPLAIELAAARVKALSPTALLKQLDNTLRLLTSGPRDVPARQQTLRATIGWSYNILTYEERLLFRSLSIFSGGFSLESAELLAHLGNLNLQGVDVLELIAALVDHSLLQSSIAESTSPRWSMLHVIREFGIDLLKESGELENLQRLHSEVTASIVAGAETGLYDSGQVEWLKKLGEEENNVRSALDWAIENQQRDVGLRIAGPIWRFWSFQHRGEEGRARLKKLLALPGEALPVATGLALRGAGCLAEDIGDYENATRFHEAAMQIWSEIGDQPRLSRTLDDLGNVAHDQGNFDAAVALHNQALELAKSCGYNRGVIRSLSNLGATAYLQGDLQTAKLRWQEAMESGIIDDPISQAMILNNLGVACMQLGDLDLATAHMNKALAIHQQIGTQSTTADVYINLSDIAMRKGEFERYRSYFDEATELYRKADDPKGLHNAYFSLGVTALDRGNAGEALTSFAESLHYADRANNRLGIADAISRIAGIAADSGRLRDAAVLIGIEDSMRRSMNSVPLPSQITQIEELHDRLKRGLGVTEFTSAYQKGQDTSQRQAVLLAVDLAAELSQRRPTMTKPEVSDDSSPSLFRLTKRESEVLKLLAEGKTDRDIAVELWISPRTAGTHVANILGKLEVDTRAAAVAAAFRYKILPS